MTNRLDSILESAWNTYNIHLSSYDVLDQKANTTLAGVGIIITLIVSLMPDCGKVAWWLNLIYVLSLVSIFFSGFMSLLVYRVRDIALPTPPKELLSYDKNDDETSEMLINLINDCIEENRPINKKKVKFLNASLVFLVIGIALIVVRAILAV